MLLLVALSSVVTSLIGSLSKNRLHLDATVDVLCNFAGNRVHIFQPLLAVCCATGTVHVRLQLAWHHIFSVRMSQNKDPAAIALVLGNLSLIFQDNKG